MDKFTHLCDFLNYLFDDDRSVDKAPMITAGILKARSCRLSEVPEKCLGRKQPITNVFSVLWLKRA